MHEAGCTVNDRKTLMVSLVNWLVREIGLPMLQRRTAVAAYSIVVFTLTFLVASSAIAQEAVDPASAPPPEQAVEDAAEEAAEEAAPAGEVVDQESIRTTGRLSNVDGGRKLIAEQLYMLALQTLAGNSEKPTDDQVTLADILLKIAIDTYGEEPEFWRQLVRMSDLREDDAMYGTAIENYLRLQTDDEAIQFELIRNRLEKLQTLDERITGVQQYLRRFGDRLSPPVRSRLASYIAQLAYERGDNASVVTWVDRALNLDNSNAEAAALNFELAREAGDEEAASFAMLQLLQATPADAQTRLDVAELMYYNGLFSEAASQYQMAVNMLGGGLLPPQYYRPWVVSLASAGGFRPIHSVRLLGMLEQIIGEKLEGRLQDDANPAAADAGPELQLPLELEIIRASILRALTNRPPRLADDETDWLGSYRTSWSAIARRLKDDADLGGEEQAIDRAWMSALLGDDLIEAEQLLQAIEDQANPAVQRGLAYVALRRGDTDEAMTIFQGLDKDDRYVQLGLADVIGERGSFDKQVRLLQLITRREPGSLPSLLAALRLYELDELVQPSQLGGELRQAVNRMDAKIWSLVGDDQWAVLTISFDDRNRRYDYLEPIDATVSIRNTTNSYLPIGSNMAVPSQVLFLMEDINRGGGAIGRRSIDKVVSVGRRVALAPQASFETRVRLDRSNFGLLARETPQADLAFNLRTVLGPAILGNGQIVPGPTGDERPATSVLVTKSPVSQRAANSYLRALQSNDLDVRLRGLARLLKLNQFPPPQGLPPNINGISDLILRAFSEGTLQEQIWILMFVPRADLPEAAPYKPIFDLAARTDDRRMRISYLINHVRNPDSPNLLAAIRHSDPLISNFARSLRVVLAEAQVSGSDPLGAASDLSK